MKKLLVLLMALFTLAQGRPGKERYPHRNGQHRLNSPSSS
jgi:hypothetical protein